VLTSNTTNNEGNRRLWDYPWKYAESFIIAIEIFIAGIIVEIISGGTGVTIPGMPVNIFVILFFTAILLFLHIFFRESPVIKWLSSIPAAISAISIYAFMVLLLGFIPQDLHEYSKFLTYTGLSHVKSSWPFVLIQFYFLASLGMVILKRAIPFKKKNLGFLLNHFGLWLTLLAAGLGSADLKRLSINTYEATDATNLAVAQNGVVYRMPFSIKLLDFDVVQYDPKLAIVSIETNKYIMGKAKSLPFVSKGLNANIADWHIQVQEYIPQATTNKNGNIVISDTIGNLVIASKTNSNDTIKGWIASGSFNMNPIYLQLNAQEVLILTPPEPKKYSSEIVVYTNDTKADTVTLEVNSPYSVSGWDIYQSAYDDTKGKWSTLSVIEAVSDPWLPIVYFGIALLIGGSLYLFWIGKNKKDKDLKNLV
jgi:hypothetical protein